MVEANTTNSLNRSNRSVRPLESYPTDQSGRQEYFKKNLKARDFLNYLLVEAGPDVGGSFVHEAWRTIKHQALEDPQNPYRGYGEKRVKVRDLDQSTRDSFCLFWVLLGFLGNYLKSN